MRAIRIGLLLTVGLAGAASAAPFVVVDGTPRFMAMMDQSSVVRGGAKVEADFPLVSAAGDAAITSFRFDCTARTWHQLGQRDLADDLTLSPVVRMSGAPGAVSSGSLGASMLERACFNRQVNTHGGWTIATVGKALRESRAAQASMAPGP